jgi:hypothetical protein
MATEGAQPHTEDTCSRTGDRHSQSMDSRCGARPAHHSISRQREGLGVITPVNPGQRSAHRHALSGLLFTAVPVLAESSSRAGSRQDVEARESTRAGNGPRTLAAAVDSLLQPTDRPLCGPAGLLEMAADHARIINPSAWEICATKEHGYIDGDLPRRKNCDGCDSARARRALTRLRDCGESR